MTTKLKKSKLKVAFRNGCYLIGVAALSAGSYFFIPQRITQLSNQVSLSQPLSVDLNRQQLMTQYGQQVAEKLPEQPALYWYWYAQQRKLADLRVQAAVTEIKNYTVPAGQIRIWSLLNMGVVMKTATQTVAIDVANLPFSTAHQPLIDLVDLFLVTHVDSDHFDSRLLLKALAKEKKVGLLTGIFLTRQPEVNLFYLSSGQPQTLAGLTVTAYQTDHRGEGDFSHLNAWYLLEINGFKILHTGDGRDFKNPAEADLVYRAKDYDLLLGNVQLHPYNLRDLQPQVLIPLHLFKFMSGQGLYQESTVDAVRAKYAQYSEQLTKSKIMYLLPGEGVSLPIN